MKELFFCLLKSIIILSILIFFSANLSADDSDISSIELDIENALIIKEIEMETDPYQSDQADGFIIMDNSFSNELLQSSSVPHKKNFPQNDINSSNNNDLSLLKKNDQRWHITEYTIKKYDNIWTIAQDFDTDHRLIIRYNKITNPDIIKPGRIIGVPNRKGIFYIIKKGDNIYNLSKKYDIPQNNIIEHNKLNPQKLAVGQKLFIPDAIKKTRINLQKELTAQNEEIKYKPVKFIWPLRGKITSSFGKRNDPFTGKKAFHCGIDISAKECTKIRASSGGKVIFSGWKNGYGNVVILRHKDNFITVYAHNSKNNVKFQDTVNRGDVIALSGKTGAVTGAHLHFEIRKYVNPLNPLRFL